jgi:hypothetical protein
LGGAFFKTTLSLIADPDGPINETSGQGDLVVFEIFLPKRQKWGAWGIEPFALEWT